ncbi:MAG: guanylate kinase [Gammaproteobacteria bacterium]|nr:guanylate kinase [Gammaproteobacteria bacterium]|tara:strand:+ start:3186 stop:3803 length:618 start_codon:yes stop_codon:yes gene_type:complete
MSFDKEIYRNLCVISAPSGAGKTSLIQSISSEENIKLSISYTTRKPRIGEIDGEDYFFISPSKFKKKIKDNQFIEHANVYDHYYGTSIDQINTYLSDENFVILEIDYQGAYKIKEKIPNSRSIFILPPSIVELESRLKKRNLDNKDTIAKRMNNAAHEIKQAKNFDYILINDNFDDASFVLKGYVQDRESKFVTAEKEFLIQSMF